MNQGNEDLNNLKGQPPPYTEGASPSGINTAPNTMAQPTGVVYQANVVPTVIPVVVGNQMGPKESAMNCPSCNRQIVTKVEYKATMRTHVFAALLCLFGCWPCVFIPYCVNSCRNANHYCPNCNAYIGSYTS